MPTGLDNRLVEGPIENRVHSVAYQPVPAMPDTLPLSSQLQLYKDTLIKSEEKSTLMTFSQSR